MAVLQNIYSRASAAATATGNSGVLPTGAANSIALDINISAVTGTTPSCTFTFDRQGADGNWYTVYTSSAQTATGNISTDIGPGCAVNHVLTGVGRLTWTISGTTPSFTFSASVVGK